MNSTIKLKEEIVVTEVGVKQADYAKGNCKDKKREFGQFFTDPQIADFMCSLITVEDLDPDCIRLLDCGAGHGMLTLTASLMLKNNGAKKVSATLYEIDKSIIAPLNEVMLSLQYQFEIENKVFEFQIIEKDFVLERPDLRNPAHFDVAIINPPYFKYSAKDSPYSKKTKDLFKGDPNIYASFMAITVASLKEKGQMVSITPRSFLNGLYFKGFRNFLLSNTQLEQVHLFKSRDNVFTASDVLQENVIIKFRKTTEEAKRVKVSTSHNSEDLLTPEVQICDPKIVTDPNDKERIIRLPSSITEYNILLKARNLPATFSEEGYFISTGPVVEHRSKQFILQKHSKKDSTPLIRTHNLQSSILDWSGRDKRDASVVTGKNQVDKFLVENKPYVITKRITSKEEKRRLVTAVYSPMSGKSKIGITNKLNYIGHQEGLTIVEALGLSAYFNSSFMDSYYRCISGSTQVNATDIRVMRIPKREKIIQLGETLHKTPTIDASSLETLIRQMHG